MKFNPGLGGELFRGHPNLFPYAEAAVLPIEADCGAPGFLPKNCTGVF